MPTESQSLRQALGQALDSKPDPLPPCSPRPVPRDAGQITFYLYDRGQAFAKGEEVLLALVNMNGCAAHYVATRSEQRWEFFQMPHLCTERRACERMGYKNLEHMHEHLFGLFAQHTAAIGWPAAGASVLAA